MADDKWWDRLAGSFAEAVTDIRRRVVEEPWFGKPQDGPLGASRGESGPSVHMKVVDSHTTYNKTTTSHEAHFSINLNGSAWDWTPDPRATAELQKPAHEFGGTRPDETAPGERGPAHGIDR